MSKVKRLLSSYAGHIQVPWRETAAAQRVIFCVCPEAEELRLRARIEEFELATRNAGHGWEVFDLTDTFAQWLSGQRYARKYFVDPSILPLLLPKYEEFIVTQFRAFLADRNPSDNDVVALKGVGSLFGFLKVKTVMQKNLGEISRHLAATNIGHRQDDIAYLSQDYPILPVRRRFWENTLRVLDQTGTDSQLRNQLSMIHKVIQTNLDAELGHVIPADYLYFDSADKLLQARVLPRKVHERTIGWMTGNDDQRLMARACGLVFLITKLAGSNNEVGIRADVDTLADLMVEDLSAGSGSLRTRLPALLDQCELLMRVGDQYRIQTEESAAWNDEFLSQRHDLVNQSHRIEAERDDRIRRRFGDLVKKRTWQQGEAKVEREFYPLFDASLPADAKDKVYVWVRDEWSIDENSVRADARQAGNQSPTLFVFIPKRSADDLRHHLIDGKAAHATLEKRGSPNSPEGKEARAAMETTRQTAEGKISELLDESFSGARVFQGGGTDVTGSDLQAIILEGAEKSFKRLYPQFGVADHALWGKVYANAKKGAPDALKAVDYDGEPAQNPVCKAVLAQIGPGKKGAEIRTHFENAPYGWSGDAVDGGLQVLLVAGLIRAADERGTHIDPKDLERKAIGKALFKVESNPPGTAQRIQIRKVMQRLGVVAKQGEEMAAVPAFLQKAFELAERAGGDAPPARTPQHVGPGRYPHRRWQRAAVGHLQPPRRIEAGVRRLGGSGQADRIALAHLDQTPVSAAARGATERCGHVPGSGQEHPGWPSAAVRSRPGHAAGAVVGAGVPRGAEFPVRPLRGGV